MRQGVQAHRSSRPASNGRLFLVIVVQFGAKVPVNQQALVVVRQNDIPSADIAMKNSAVEEGAVVRC